MYVGMHYGVKSFLKLYRYNVHTYLFSMPYAFNVLSLSEFPSRAKGCVFCKMIMYFLKSQENKNGTSENFSLSMDRQY